MAAESFAALFLAHVIADYLLQTAWLVDNKRRPEALGLHIGLVFVTMIAVTFTLSPWFFLLAGLHLLIDIGKTFFLPEGLRSYVLDQLLHISSIIFVVSLAPDLWLASPLSDVDGLPLAFAVAAGVIFAARGGQFAIDILLAGRGAGTSQGVLLGVLERSFLAGTILAGLFWIAGAVIAAKIGYLAFIWGQSDPTTRDRLRLGTLASLAWALITALPLAIWLTQGL